MKQKIAIVTLVIPQYRKGFFDRIFNNKNYEITIYCQDDLKGLNLKLIHHEYPNDRVKKLKHINISNFTFIWQFTPWKELYNNYDIIFIEGNPRVLNHFILASIFSILGKKVVLWSMVHSFKNNQFNKKLRVGWMKMFKYHFLYNERELEYLTRIGFKNKIMVPMNNGLDQKLIDDEIAMWPKERLKQWRIDKLGVNEGFDIITLGRLLTGKYENLLISLKQIKESHPNVKCCIIGDGEAKEKLEKLTLQYGLQENIHFAGALFLEHELCPYMLSSKVCVHPTAMGLTIMHVFGYSLPVITHDHFSNHGPEIVALENEYNGLLYKYEDLTDLTNKILRLINDNTLYEILSRNANQMVKEKYNTEMMAKNFFALVSQIK